MLSLSLRTITFTTFLMLSTHGSAHANQLNSDELDHTLSPAKAFELGEYFRAWENLERVRKLYKRACDGQIMVACSRLAEAYMVESRHIKTDYVKAAAYAKQACDGNNARGCSVLGAILSRGEDEMPVERKKGYALFLRACDLGSGYSCDLLARYAKRSEEKLALQRKACEFAKTNEESSGMICVRLARMYRDGEGVAKNPKLALRYLNEVCDWRTGGGYGCIELATMYTDGQGVAVNKNLAQRYTDRGCEKTHANLCRERGDPRPSIAKRKAQCENDNYAFACQRLARMQKSGYIEGYKFKPNPTYALELFIKACKLGDKPSCQKFVGRMYEDGDEAFRDYMNSNMQYIQGCKDGLFSCHRK